ncbi:hypothetical protein [Desulfonatronospira sp.]|uniref:hypothetical protein n=1 Tax=Desulfonatronospira sp. TaxID=1962951 RepID=UPI0025C71F89|nr:hypothetical protein [Desulfonatronospira sp.]
MNERYLIQKIATCDKCQGRGKVENPLWTELIEEVGEDYIKNLSKHDYNQLLIEKGLLSFGRYEPREMKCSNCKGSGEFFSSVNLEDVPVVDDLMKRVERLENRS